VNRFVFPRVTPGLGSSESFSGMFESPGVVIMVCLGILLRVFNANFRFKDASLCFLHRRSIVAFFSVIRCLSRWGVYGVFCNVFVAVDVDFILIGLLYREPTSRLE